MKSRLKFLFFFFLLTFFSFFPLTAGSIEAAEAVKLDLDAVVKITQKFSPRIEIVRQQVEQRRGLLTQAQSGYLPHLAVEAGVGRQFIDNLEPYDKKSVNHASVIASQLIYDKEPENAGYNL